MSFQEDGYRTGLPKICPTTNKQNPTTTSTCIGCLFHLLDDRGHWRCQHQDYQNAPGVHFCLGCGIELGAWAEVNRWEYCGGPSNKCRYEMGLGGLSIAAPSNHPDLKTLTTI